MFWFLLIFLIVCIILLIFSIKFNIEKSYSGNGKNAYIDPCISAAYGKPKYICKNGSGYIIPGECQIIKYDGKFAFIQGNVVRKITNEEFQSFSLKGKTDYVTKVSGGGGGGTSIAGAVVGGMVAGPVGAVIGSRKSNKPIKSEVYQVDNHSTVLNIKTGGRYYTFIFEGSALYYDLLNTCPEKEISAVNANTAEKPTEKFDSKAEEKITKAKNLYDKGIITREDYEKIKTDVLKNL